MVVRVPDSWGWARAYVTGTLNGQERPDVSVFTPSTIVAVTIVQPISTRVCTLVVPIFVFE